MKRNSTNLAIGLTIASVLCGVVASSLIRAHLLAPKPAFAQQHAQSADAALVNSGRALFHAQCGGCHATDSTGGTHAPGFKGLSKSRKLPSSGRAATEQHIRDQLKKPLKNMPAFDKLSEQEIHALSAYLLTL